MLAGLIGEEHGRTTLTRVLPGTDVGPVMEVSFQANGIILGVQTNDIGTFLASARPDGSLFGDGQGLVTTPDGEVAMWRGQGIGRRLGAGGATAWRGAIFYQTTCQRLLALNGMAVVFEFDIDEQGLTQSKSWEWK
jgi:hypothetical protein